MVATEIPGAAATTPKTDGTLGVQLKTKRNAEGALGPLVDRIKEIREKISQHEKLEASQMYKAILGEFEGHYLQEVLKYIFEKSIEVKKPAGAAVTAAAGIGWMEQSLGLDAFSDVEEPIRYGSRGRLKEDGRCLRRLLSCDTQDEGSLFNLMLDQPPSNLEVLLTPDDKLTLLRVIPVQHVQQELYLGSAELLLYQFFKYVVSANRRPVYELPAETLLQHKQVSSETRAKRQEKKGTFTCTHTLLSITLPSY
jgi:hypothetical protein